MVCHRCVWACEFLGALYVRKNSCTDHKKKVKVFQETEEFVQLRGGEVRRLMAKSILNFDFDYLSPAQVKHLAKVRGQTLPGGQARFLNSKCFGSEVSDLMLTRTLSPGVVHLETSWTLLSFQSRPSSWSSWPFPGPHWSVACSLKAHSSETQ